jgi:pseudaminic acid cytidylyltransferase
MNIAIIPARGGSKRIPRKNIKLFYGKPIIAYVIETAIKSKLFDEVMVSTEDEEIADIAKSYGASVPFMRTNENANDFAGTGDVITEVLMQLKKEGKFFESACCIYPTAPFISLLSLKTTFSLLTQNKYDSVFPICAFSYPILRSLILNDKGKVEMKWPEFMNARSQDLPTFYHDAGQFYWLNVESFLKKKLLFSDNSGVFVLNELEVQDIDNETDWALAELKYQLLYFK